MRLVSGFGARFDMETDAVLIMALAILAWRFGKAGAWVLLCGLLRYLFVAAGGLWPWLRGPLAPSARGRAICVVQFVGLSLAVLPVIHTPLSGGIAAAALVALCYSFLIDVMWLRRQVAFKGCATDGGSVAVSRSAGL